MKKVDNHWESLLYSNSIKISNYFSILNIDVDYEKEKIIFNIQNQNESKFNLGPVKVQNDEEYANIIGELFFSSVSIESGDVKTENN